VCELIDYLFIVIDYSSILEVNMTYGKQDNRLPVIRNRLYCIAIEKLFYDQNN